MIGWAPCGERVTSFENMRPLLIGQTKILIDCDASASVNAFTKAFGVSSRGRFAVDETANFVRLFSILKNMFDFHRVIYGTEVLTINDARFGVFLPSYDSIFDHMKWEDLEFSRAIVEKTVNEARKFAFQMSLSQEEFFKLFPETGCPYEHSWNDDKDDIESTCTLCEGLQTRSRSRSRSPRLAMAKRCNFLQGVVDDWESWQAQMCVCDVHIDYPTPSGLNSDSRWRFSCLECGVHLGMHNPRQLCGKSTCLNL